MTNLIRKRTLRYLRNVNYIKFTVIIVIKQIHIVLYLTVYCQNIKDARHKYE